MVSEFKGLSTSQTLSKPDAPGFSWKIVTSDEADKGAETRELPPTASIDVLLNKLAEYILNRGYGGFLELREYLMTLEKQIKGTTKIDRDDLREAMLSWGVPMDGRYLDKLIDRIDAQKTQLIDWRDFIVLVRGPLSYARQDVLIDLFSKMDTSGNGVIESDVLKGYFSAEKHPLYAEDSTADLYSQLLRCCCYSNAFAPRRSKSAPGSITEVKLAITFENFCEYYADLGAIVADDGDFETMVRSHWSI
jgi:hypothetical protein